MKNDTMPAIVRLEANDWANLLTEVKETLATDIEMNTVASRKQSFGVADLWNIRRKSKSAFSMRNRRNF